MRGASIILMMLLAAGCSRQPASNDVAEPAAPAAPQNAVSQNAGRLETAPAEAAAEDEAVADDAETESAAVAEETPPPAPKAEGCAGEIGLAAARRLVAQCVQVSPATHPPCHVANSCALIRDEIERSCRLFEADAPDSAPGICRNRD